MFLIFVNFVNFVEICKDCTLKQLALNLKRIGLLKQKIIQNNFK